MYRGLAIAVAVFLLGVNFAYAEIKINEFVSDPDTGAEWIELWNDSSVEIDLSGYSWTELAGPGSDTEHESNPKNLSGTISAAGFFVFEMNSALNNTGDSVGLYQGANLLDRVTFGVVNGYQKNLDAPAKGKSGALIGGTWQTNQEPTKGQANPSSSSSSADNNSSSSSSSSSSSTSPSTSTQTTAATATPSAPQKIRTEVSVRNIAYVGIPHSFAGRVMRGSVPESHGRYFWNFGDGDFREVKVINTDKFTHTFFYPGDYSVIFEYYPDSFTEEPEASQKINIKVIVPQVSIARVGDANDFFVELANNTSYDVDMSGWMLSGYGKSFTIPKNTFIVANKKIIIAGRTSGLTLYDLPNLKLFTPAGELAFAYYTYQPTQKNYSVSPKTVSKNISKPVPQPDLAVKPPSENLPAGVAYAEDLAGGEEDSIFSSWLWPAIFVGLLALAGYGVYILRQKKAPLSSGNDFEILEE